MPKVTHVKSARKDNPAVKKGESYYHWAFFRGAKHYSRTPPKQSQLTQTKMSAVYSVQEEIEGFSFGTCTTLDEFSNAKDVAVDFLNEQMSELEEPRDGYEESAENIREAFTESPTADECEEKSEQIQEYMDLIEEKAGDCEGVEIDVDSLDKDDDDYDDDFQQAIDDAIVEIEGYIEEATDCPC